MKMGNNENYRSWLNEGHKEGVPQKGISLNDVYEKLDAESRPIVAVARHENGAEYRTIISEDTTYIYVAGGGRVPKEQCVFKRAHLNMNGSFEVIDSDLPEYMEDDVPYDVPPEEDLINAPDHYHKGGIDIYDIMKAKFGIEWYRGFCMGNVLKYTIRHEMKEPIASLEKAEFNLRKLIDSYKESPGE